MSLQSWLQIGHLTNHQATVAEVRSLLGVVDRELADAGVAGLSDDGRFTGDGPATLHGRAKLAAFPAPQPASEWLLTLSITKAASTDFTEFFGPSFGLAILPPRFFVLASVRRETRPLSRAAFRGSAIAKSGRRPGTRPVGHWESAETSPRRARAARHRGLRS